MINRVELKNFGPIEQLDWQDLGKINLVIGNNGCGKSFLLKAIYSAIRTIEEYKRGDSPDFQNIDEVLKDKLWWTFQPDKITDLINTNASELEFNLLFNNSLLDFSLDKTQSKLLVNNTIAPRKDNSVYLPAKEVLSLFHIIFSSRENKKEFGFDETYFDLVKALLAYNNQLGDLYTNLNQTIQIKEELYSQNDKYEIAIKGLTQFQLEQLEKDASYKALIEEFKESISEMKSHIEQREKEISEKIEKEENLKNIFQECKNQLNNMIGGELEYNQDKNRWYFKKGQQYFSIGITAEGIKKIAILDTLFNNGYLNENSIIFIDELEANLHPTAISELLNIIAVLANKCGIQFFIASHSYFVIKKLFLIAQEQQMSIPVLSYQNNEWVQSDLKDDLPDNPIVDESIRLYEEQLDLAGV